MDSLGHVPGSSHPSQKAREQLSLLQFANAQHERVKLMG
jgi:hypothetical protein